MKVRAEHSQFPQSPQGSARSNAPLEYREVFSTSGALGTAAVWKRLRYMATIPTPPQPAPPGPEPTPIPPHDPIPSPQPPQPAPKP